MPNIQLKKKKTIMRLYPRHTTYTPSSIKKKSYIMKILKFLEEYSPLGTDLDGIFSFLDDEVSECTLNPLIFCIAWKILVRSFIPQIRWIFHTVLSDWSETWHAPSGGPFLRCIVLLKILLFTSSVFNLADGLQGLD